MSTPNHHIKSTESVVKRKLARSYALSRFFNPRNIEHEWYPLWAHLLFDMVANEPNLIVCPQFPVWISPEEEEADPTRSLMGDEGIEDPPTPKLPPRVVKVKAQIAIKQQLALLDSESSLGTGSHDSSSVASDRSTQSHHSSSASQLTQGTNVSGATTALKQGLTSRIPDYAIIKLIQKDPPRSNLNRRYNGIEIEKAEVKLLVELKRFASRSLPFDDPNDNRLLDAIHRILHIAHNNILQQAALVFLKFPDLHQVKAIVACGDYWRIATIARENISSDVFEALGIGNYSGRREENANWSDLMTMEEGIDSLVGLSEDLGN